MSMFKVVFGVLILIVFSVIQANAIDQSICYSGANVVIHPNGSLKSCDLKDDFPFGEIKCKSRNRASFYDNGQLETCVLAQPATIGGQACQESGPR